VFETGPGEAFGLYTGFILLVSEDLLRGFDALALLSEIAILTLAIAESISVSPE
jgi:hypothetical protein